MHTVPETPVPLGNALSVVREWALSVMRSFGLHDWSFEFTKARRMLGVCRFGRQAIGLSIHLVQRNGPEEVRETLLHEVAHALVGPCGHGPVWREMARRVGCKPVRCGDADMPEGRWQAACPSCGRRFHRHRKPRPSGRWWCRRCGRVRGVLTWRLAEEV